MKNITIKDLSIALVIFLLACGSAPQHEDNSKLMAELARMPDTPYFPKLTDSVNFEVEKIEKPKGNFFYSIDDKYYFFLDFKYPLDYLNITDSDFKVMKSFTLDGGGPFIDSLNNCYFFEHKKGVKKLCYPAFSESELEEFSTDDIEKYAYSNYEYSSERIEYYNTAVYEKYLKEAVSFYVVGDALIANFPSGKQAWFYNMSLGHPNFYLPKGLVLQEEFPFTNDDKYSFKQIGWRTTGRNWGGNHLVLGYTSYGVTSFRLVMDEDTLYCIDRTKKSSQSFALKQIGNFDKENNSVAIQHSKKLYRIKKIKK